jgi:hypothetical protein
MTLSLPKGQGGLEHGAAGEAKGHEAWTTGGSTGGGGGIQ